MEAALLSFRESGARHFAKSTRLGAQSKQKQDNSATLDVLWKKYKFPLVALGIAGAVMSGYVVMLVISITRAPQCNDDGGGNTPSGRPLDLRQGRITATAFDRDLNRPESLMGIAGLRELMGGLARGHVLEVAVGTGRNIEYIDWDEIRATAPPFVTEAEGVVREVKSEKQLAKERVMRRIEKGKKGLILPGDESPEVLSYTGVDVSTDVLEVAWVKLRKVLPELIPRRKKQVKVDGDAQQLVQQQTPTPSSTAASPPSTPLLETEMTLAANVGQGRIRLYKSDAQTRLPPPPARSSHDGTKTLPAPPYYDTILQNFGLCSVSDPQRMLANMAAMLQPGSGRIYLLEHGRGWYGWLNGLLDKFAPAHFQRYGCWWNRDIEAIVRKGEEEVPGLEIVRLDRPLTLQAGTMLWIELRVNPDKVPKSGTEVGKG